MYVFILIMAKQSEYNNNNNNNKIHPKRDLDANAFCNDGENPNVPPTHPPTQWCAKYRV